MKFFFIICFIIINILHSNDSNNYYDDLFTREELKDENELIKQRAGMVGRSGKYLMLNINALIFNRVVNNKEIPSLSLGPGIRGGMISYLTDDLGIRGYASLDITQDKLNLNKKAKKNFNGLGFYFNAGLDIIFSINIKDHRNFVGFFVGIGYGIFFYYDKKLKEKSYIRRKSYIRSVGISSESGIFILFNRVHNVEIGAKFLPSSFSNQSIFKAQYMPFISYSYKFNF